MRRQREIGTCRAYCRDGNCCFELSPENYEPLLAAWMAGKAFYQGTGFFGELLTIKLGGIDGVEHSTPEQLAELRAARAADKADDAINGTGE